MIDRVCVVGLSLVLLAGCRGLSRQLERDFRAAHPSCTGRVDYQERPGGGENTAIFDVSGCGIRDTMYRECQTAGFGFYGRKLECRFNSAAGAARQWSFASGCPVASAQTVELGPSQLGVHGCGQRQVYVSTMKGWVLHTSSTGEDLQR